jgi:hypothetical protein
VALTHIGREIAISPNSHNENDCSYNDILSDPQTNAIMNMDLLDLMWSDPNDDIHGVIPSRRFGTNDLSVTSVEFGPDVARDFCKRNHIDVIVRGHEVAEDVCA